MPVQRKEYASPSLVVLGTVSELTLTTSKNAQSEATKKNGSQTV